MLTSSSKNFGKLSMGLTLVLGSIFAQQASAHGYIESPISRSQACYKELNAGCKDPSEPQGVEFGGGGPASGLILPGAEAFPRGGPKDGDIAAGGLTSKYGNLNPQTANRWAKTKINTGKNTFTWHYTAPHRTAYWQFFITKKDWSPNMPLTRGSFESTPINEEFHDGTNADSKLGGKKSSHTFDIPSDRSGYQVILATWKTSDTSATFYQVVDVDVQNGGVAPVPSKWSPIGSIEPTQTDLKVDSVVTARVLVGGAEDFSKQTILKIDSDADGKSTQWPHRLATKINAENHGYQAGQLNKKDQVIPAYGMNTAYVQKDSNVSGLIIDIQRASPAFSMDISGMHSTYKIENGKVTLHFVVKAIGDASRVQNIVYNAQREEVARSEADVNDGSEHFTINVQNAVAGNYDLVTIAKAKSGKVVQKTSSFKMIGGDIVDPVPPNPDVPPANDDYDYVYPNGRTSYTEGTRVLQPKDGSVYQCKPLPAAGWCVQDIYAPGSEIGYWTEAWIKVSK